MSETKFTPGPWRVCNFADVFTQLGAKNKSGDKADESDGWQVADCNVSATFVDEGLVSLNTGEVRANAHLIAASPLLYRQVKASAEMLESLSAELRGRISHDARSSMKEMANELFKSLAIARGES